MKITQKTEVDAPFDMVRKNFNRHLLEQLNPPGTALTIHRFDGIFAGASMHFTVTAMGISSPWEGIITQVHEGNSCWAFIDQGKLLPPGLRSWQHLHVLLRQNDSTIVYDRVEFSGKNRFFTAVWRLGVWMMLRIRKPRYKQYFTKLP